MNLGLGVLNGAMLLGLLGVAVPLAIHFLNRRRDVIIDWGAMQFLELGRKARQKLKLTELLLMLARMAVLAVVALALARPYSSWGSGGSGTGIASKALSLAGGTAAARDVVVIIDNSASMGRPLESTESESAETTTPKRAAIAWTKALAGRLQAGDSIAVLKAGERVQTLAEPSFDRVKLVAVLDDFAKGPPKGSSDLPAAVAEAFRILERTKNPDRDVVILSDNQRLPWKPSEAARWSLLREIRQRAEIAPRLWSLAFDPRSPTADEPNGALGPLRLAVGMITPSLPLKLSAELTNHGPGPLSRPAELWVDGRAIPGTSQNVEALPEGGKTTLNFKTTLETPGPHVVTVKLGGLADAMPGDDESTAVVEVTEAFGVLLVEGEPGVEPLSSETDFLRAALAPTGDDKPQTKAKVVKPDELNAAALEGRSVVVLANVERVGFDQGPALARFVDQGGGILIAPGDRVDPLAYNALGWLPAKLGEKTGDYNAKKSVAHPNPSSFNGPVLSAFGPSSTGTGSASATAEGNDAPALGRASLFGYYRLELSGNGNAEGAVTARLDNGDPWAIERQVGKGRVLLLAGPLDAEGGTLPVNPDFVPLIHEWMFHLAGGTQPQAVKPGEPLVFNLNKAIPNDLTKLRAFNPDGTETEVPITRTAGLARARIEDTGETGLYRLALPNPVAGSTNEPSYLYGMVEGENRESDLQPLETAEAEKIAEGWPLTIGNDPKAFADEVLSGEGGAKGGRQELWKALILAALAGLCIEIYLTRRLVRGL